MGERVRPAHRRTRGGWLVLLVAAAVSPGCAGLHSTVRTSASALSSASTFTFFDAAHGRTGSLDRDAQIAIQNALERGLEAHGYVSSAEPDLLVSFTALTEPVEGFASIGYRLPGGFGGFDIGATVSPLLERIELEVTILDLRTNRVALYLRSTGKVSRGRQLRHLRDELVAALGKLPEPRPAGEARAHRAPAAR